MSCGFGNLTNHNSIGQSVLTNVFSVEYKSVWLYTSYLGRVKVRVGSTTNPNIVKMECKGVGSASDIVVREVDVIVAGIDTNSRPTLRTLSNKPPAVVNISENKENFYLIQKLEIQRAILSGDIIGVTLRQTALDKFSLLEPDLSSQLERKYVDIIFDAEKLRSLYVKNCVVDIHFNTTLYLEFLQEKLNRPSINNGTLLLSLFNVADMDNAYFSGEYMVYGNGKTYFYPLASIDVASHELTHGLVQATAGLEYSAESGALNESFADVMGTAFEFWLYDRFNKDDDPNNDIFGESDWLIGEDIGKTMKYLRNMKNPNTTKQPKKYKGQYWVDTRDTSSNNDYGGVHQNSGVGNFCFYLLSQEVGQSIALSIFYNCLLKLNRTSDYTQFRDALVECTSTKLKEKTKHCLAVVGLPYSSILTNPTDHDPQMSSGLILYPNAHIPYIKGVCCPHCLCLQKKTRMVDEPAPRTLRYTHDLTQSSDSESSESAAELSPPPLRRSKRRRINSNIYNT